MNLTKSNGKVVEERGWPGLVTCKIEHEIKASTGDFEYIGPVISREVWHGAMSFLRYAYQRTQGEAQLRFYVNVAEGIWRAWAYPQKASMGLHTEELTSKDSKEVAKQRAQFGDDWLYFMTLHSHANAGAFQSTTDENNEKAQDGIHITVGQMGNDRHDLHARFYMAGNCFTPDLSQFWDIGAQIKGLIPGKLWSDVAAHQMCAKVDAPFPDQWKENLIEVKTAVVVHDWRDNWCPGYGIGGSAWNYRDACAIRAINAIIQQSKLAGYKIDEVADALDEFSDDNDIHGIILKEARRESVDADDLIKAWNQLIEEKTKDAQKDKSGKGGKGKNNEPATGETWSLGYSND